MTKAILFDLDGLVIIGQGKLFSDRVSEEMHIPSESISEFFTKDFRECSFGRSDLKENIAPYLVAWGYKGTVDDFLRYWFEGESHTDEEVLSLVNTLRSRGIECYIATRQEKYRKEYLMNVVGLKDKFDGIFATCDIGYDKWEEGYWKYVFDKLNMIPEEIMFFCDSEKNVENAKTFGVEAYFYTDINLLKEKIAHLL
ncbi:MAG: HAD hydrolase-like protein [Candidatus Yonathbacteria bacterium]|nr:HAD hydrolase-like protein [Candidatus Yonathbacteria bacterium]NTW48119.1 HAD hydrolase-like protein [Candidatus Yonathbacteria bacterium]